jgi:hypothetical protein
VTSSNSTTGPLPGLPMVMLIASLQALRAVVTGLIPLTLISLFGWASAGSASGDTSAALRGAGLLWLASHHVAIDLSFATTATTGLFSVLPIGLLIIPILTLRGAGLRLAREVKGAKLEVLVFAALVLAFIYSMLVTAVALLADSGSIAPRYVEAFGYALVLALIAGGSRLLHITWPERWRAVVAFFKLSMGLLLLLGVVLVVIGLLANLQEVSNMFSVLRLGILSGFFVVIAGLLYLPNAAIWAVAYITGAGFGFGTNSLIWPWGSTLGVVPTFPLFAAIPAAPPRLAPFFPLVVLIVMLVAAVRTHRSDEGLRWAALRLVAVALIAGLLMAWFSGGSLVGGALQAVGPSLWKFPLVLAAHVLVGFFLGVGTRALAHRIRPPQRLSRS